MIDSVKHNLLSEEAEQRYAEVSLQISNTLRYIHQVRLDCLALEMQLKDIIDKFSTLQESRITEFDI